METLDELMTERGVPRYTRVDNAGESASNRLKTWLEKKVTPVFIESGNPWENGFVESFQGKLRDECLNEDVFWIGRRPRWSRIGIVTCTNGSDRIGRWDIERPWKRPRKQKTGSRTN